MPSYLRIEVFLCPEEGKYLDNGSKAPTLQHTSNESGLDSSPDSNDLSDRFKGDFMHKHFRLK